MSIMIVEAVEEGQKRKRELQRVERVKKIVMTQALKVRTAGCMSLGI